MKILWVLLPAAALALAVLAGAPAPRAGAAKAAPRGGSLPETPACSTPVRSREGAAAGELLSSIVSTQHEKGSQARTKACFDAVRALGPAALPTLLEGLGSEDPEVASAALRALSGLRSAARSLPGLIAEGRSVEEMAATLDLPVGTVQAWINHGPWSAAATEAMGEAAWKGFERATSVPAKSDALAALYRIGDESPVAAARLVEAARSAADPVVRDRALSFAASRGAEGDAAPLSRLALDPAAPDELRTRAALAWLRAVQDRPEAPGRADLCTALLATAERDMNDASLTEDRRIAAAELGGRLGGPATVVALLRSGGPESLRCAALKTLLENGGFETARGRIEEVAAETEDSAAKDLARRLLKLNPAGEGPARR